MRIVVFIKQVPEVSELRLDPVTRRLDREGAASMMNPFDRRAMLEAHRLREEVGGTIAAVTMGPPQAESVLRECLGLGADRVVHLSDRRFAGADTLATARALARTAERVGFDLVLAGRYSIDSETGQVGPEVAALLGVPFLGGVRRLDVRLDGSEWTLAAECEGDDGFVACEGPPPAVVTCTDRWKTRIPRILPDEERAAEGPVEVWTVDDLGGAADDYGQEGSPTWVEEVRPVATERRQQRVSHVEDAEAALGLVREVVSGALAGDARASAPDLVHAAPDSGAPAIWVLGERGPDGSVRSVTWELLSAADRLAAGIGARTAVFLLDPWLPEAPPAVEETLARELGRRGADVFVVGPDSARSPVEELVAAIGRHQPRIVLGPATAVGRDLVPQVAARLGLGLTGDAIGVEFDGEGRLQQLKPAFGGQVVAPILSRTRPEMVTLRPGVLEEAKPDPTRGPARIVHLEAATGRDPVFRCLRFESEVEAGAAAMEEARVVVCVGYGLGQEGVPEAQRLAERLGGVVGGTRRVCDLGWLPRQAQIGLSGRSIAPDLYIGLGARGSFNHTVGLRRAGTIVAVNNDPGADFFEGADLGVVGDARVFLTELLAQLD